MKYKSISNIEAITVERVQTGFSELDWLYGMSKFPEGNTWGMPVGTISTWVGEGGVGKSRLSISLAKNKVKEGMKILYLQNEVDMPTLASWVNDKTLNNFFCSEATALVDQIEIIKELKPDMVFVDSINLINEFGSGTAKSVKIIMDAYRKAIKGTKCHVVVLCQLNKEGSATGSTALAHLPDVNINLTNTDKDGVFKLTIGKKNRYGRKGSSYNGLWRHIETGVECISHNRMKDDRWVKTDGYKMISDFGERRKREFVSLDEFPPLPTAEEAANSPTVGISSMFDKVNSIGLPPLPVIAAPKKLSECSPAVQQAYRTLHPEEFDQDRSLLGKIIRSTFKLSK